MHQDLGDFLWSDTSVHCRGDQTDRILAYFCFPTIGVAVPLRSGDHLLFDPAVPHMISSRTSHADDVYCMSLYRKKLLEAMIIQPNSQRRRIIFCLKFKF